jgi:hypothetical protein
MLFTIAVPVLLYLLFWFWYSARQRPLSADDVAHFMHELRACMPQPLHAEMQEQVQRVAQGDDGRPFVMHNLVRYRAQAQYPGDHPLQAQTSARAADRRYARAIAWPLLRHGSLPILVARRKGGFVEPAGAEPWDYVALVRYRSRRDFLRFALSIERAGHTVHKWAAIQTTHIFPLQPLLSLFMLRTLVGLSLLALGSVLSVLVLLVDRL